MATQWCQSEDPQGLATIPVDDSVNTSCWAPSFFCTQAVCPHGGCGRTFAGARDLQAHQTVCPHRLFPCGHCREKFTSATMCDHVQRAHRDSVTVVSEGSIETRVVAGQTVLTVAGKVALGEQVMFSAQGSVVVLDIMRSQRGRSNTYYAFVTALPGSRGHDRDFDQHPGVPVMAKADARGGGIMQVKLSFERNASKLSWEGPARNYETWLQGPDAMLAKGCPFQVATDGVCHWSEGDTELLVYSLQLWLPLSAQQLSAFSGRRDVTGNSYSTLDQSERGLNSSSHRANHRQSQGESHSHCMSFVWMQVSLFLNLCLASGENCILTLVVGSADTPPIDGSCSAIVTACLMHLKICKTLRDDPSGKPMFLTPVFPFTSAEFIGSPTERWLKKHGITHEVLVLLDDVGEVMPLAPLSQVDPSFAARIDIVQVELPKPTVLAATPTAGSCGLLVSWSAYTLLEQVSLLVPARCGQELFMGAIDGAGGEETAVKESLQLAREAVMELTGNLNAKLGGQLWNQTDSDLVVALACITKGSHAAAP
ncbi:unnamed protein product [Polarella glacialis]|uniref:C2H2-type domain-containing protein n=1 Tax=Polarella glacialis TaxID=89957 RepID=A0A813FDZ5_POLGL|nr:unnamed protein product [Polarella glacialis]